MSNSGINIDEWMVLVPVNLILAGWCRVFHQSTENLIIGMLIEPIMAIILDILLALSLFKINLWEPM